MPKTPDYFHGKTIIITGAASGIGRATALVFAREGANVVCADINGDGARQAAGEVGGRGGKALPLRTDVTSRREVEDMVRHAIDAFGTLHFQFNSAGAALRRSSFLDIDEKLLEDTFALNVKGTFHCMQAVLPHMLRNRHGVIVNMASMAHRRGGPGSSVHYASAKGAVMSMTLGVAREFATAGIRCLSISPGPIRTAFQAAAQSSPELLQRFLDDVPMKRFGEPEEIAELVLFVCSDACAFMTADTIYVNGGGGWR
ncbi:MAG TPA: SDR family oxidoreductase [Xanthobacteraceae bacterium]|jgi:3-oxoacyl-[acyl-carrier protein] reductase